ncbi:hypothetical protein QJS66_17425 [Kocuria rhizophila]|nr:hypothetical protein QJS66_17425 [Kocuria rhizophila]
MPLGIRGCCGYMRAMAEFLEDEQPIQHYAWGSCQRSPRRRAARTTSSPGGSRGRAAASAVPREWTAAARADAAGPHLPSAQDPGHRRAPSIQVHPHVLPGREGFERENAAGIALDAPHRTSTTSSPRPWWHSRYMWLLSRASRAEPQLGRAEDPRLAATAAPASPCPPAPRAELSDHAAAAAVREKRWTAAAPAPDTAALRTRGTVSRPQQDVN